MSFEIKIEWTDELKYDYPYDVKNLIEDMGCYIQINANGKCFTNVFYKGGHILRNRILTSAYPIGMWIMTFYWRLLYEGETEFIGCPFWHEAHSLASLPYGFKFPDIKIYNLDWNNVMIEREPLPNNVRYGFDYLSEKVNIEDFTREIDNFIEKIISVHNSKIWDNIDYMNELYKRFKNDKNSAYNSNYRTAEAIIGLNPGEGEEEEVIEHMESIFP